MVGDSNTMQWTGAHAEAAAFAKIFINDYLGSPFLFLSFRHVTHTLIFLL